MMDSAWLAQLHASPAPEAHCKSGLEKRLDNKPQLWLRKLDNLVLILCQQPLQALEQGGKVSLD
jgi:hypothetical protein